MRYAAQLLADREGRGGHRLAGWGPLGSGPASDGGWAGSAAGVGEAGVPARSGGGYASSGGGSGSFDSGDEGAPPPAYPPAPRSRQRGRDRDASAAAVARVEEKRVRNDRIKKELGVRLAFPTYREGLAAIAAGDMRPFDL